jgi:hypothetical protein
MVNFEIAAAEPEGPTKGISQRTYSNLLIAKEPYHDC